jgi:nucleoside-diphosphate-sugar epimerase
MEKIFITGCSGALGTNLCRVLLAKGFQVKGMDIVLPRKELSDQAGFEFVQTDITDFAAVCKCAAGSQVGIHCAVLLPHKYFLGLDTYFKVNALGGVNFLKACLETGIKKAIVISTSGVLRPNRCGVTFDSAQYRISESFYLKSKIRAEEMIDGLNLKDKINYLILRPTSIYGPGMNYKWKEIFGLAAKGRLCVINPGTGLYSIIHLDDLISAIFLSIAKLDASLSGEKILITSGDKLSIYEILSFICDYFASPRPKKLPFFAVLFAVKAINVLGRITRNDFLSSVYQENIIDYRSGLFFDSQKAWQLLGFEAKMNFKLAMQEVLEKYHA